MLYTLRQTLKLLPTLFLSIFLALLVWVFAVTASDPVEEHTYPRAVSIEVIGQDPALILTSEIASEASITLSAPRSIWERLTREQVPVRAIADFSGLAAGEHSVPIQVQVGIRPVKVVSYSPSALDVKMEAISSRNIAIRLVEKGEPAVGFQAEKPVMDLEYATVTGPDSLVQQVQEVRAVLDVSLARENISRLVELSAVDMSDNPIEGLTLSPDRVSVDQRIVQRGGYRNVVVKVSLNGQIAPGFRITNISVYPPVVTVFSSDPKLVESLPGYVDTLPVNLSEARDDLNTHMPLNLPAGISLVGQQDVEVQVGIASIEGSLTLEQIPVEIINLAPGLNATISPEAVDIIFSGPLSVLESLTPGVIRIVIDAEGMGVGAYARIPRVEISVDAVKVQSVLPASIEITLSSTGTVTPTPAPSATPKVQKTP